ncbi:MAG: hypothetical protein IKU29_00595 [Parabacteroides sp.]|nr:hypothetical protein [Parabacteroides sp.]
MKELDFTNLNNIIDQWIDELAKNKKANNTVTESTDKIYEVSGVFGKDKWNKVKAKVGYVVKDKYYPDDKRLVHIFQFDYDNISFIIEDGEKIYRNKHQKHSFGVAWEDMDVLAERISQKLDLEYEKPIKSHIITDYISVTTKTQEATLHQITNFMVDKILDSKYIIFQSNFGFMGDDVPFTLICKRCDIDKSLIRFEISGNSQDWASFNIEDLQSGTLLHEWKHETLFEEKYPELKYMDAREMVESEYYRGSIYSFINNSVSTLSNNAHDELLRTGLYYKIYTALYDEYATCDDTIGGCGIVAVIYNEEV